MTELRAFNNPEFGTIRTIVEDGKTLFCGRDVANVLGYSDPKKAVARHCKGGTKRPLPTVNGLQEAIQPCRAGGSAMKIFEVTVTMGKPEVDTWKEVQS